eukprot:7387376-Prymnesium_polylepis.2
MGWSQSPCGVRFSSSCADPSPLPCSPACPSLTWHAAMPPRCAADPDFEQFTRLVLEQAGIMEDPAAAAAQE